MPNWKKVIVSGSDASLSSLIVNNGVTGSLQGTASWAVSSSQAITASFVRLALSASYASSSTTSSYSLVATSASFATNAVSASYVLSASYAATTSFAGQFNVATSLTASGLRYPTTDGTFTGQVLQTNAAGTLSFGNVNAVFETIRNGESTSITVGTALYVSGALGDQPICYRADASDPAKMPVTFIAFETIAAGAQGRGVTLGLITGINMTGYSVGEDLFINGNGTLTNIRPTGSSDIVQPIGIVTKTGSGGQLNVLNPGPVFLPNIQTGYTWVGDANNQPVAIATSSIRNVISSSYASGSTSASYALVATSASYAATASFIPTSSLTGNFFAQGGNSFGATALLGTNDTQDLQFETSGSVRMTILSGGSVGIGTTAPAYLLDVANNTRISGSILLGSTALDTTVAGLYLLTNGNNASVSTYYYDSVLSLKAGVSGGAFNNRWSQIQLKDGNSGAGYINFLTSGSFSRMYIDQVGNIGIATTTASLARLQIQGNVSASSYTGSLFGTASRADNATSASFATTAVSSSFATQANTSFTASTADNFTVRGTLTAQTIVAQTITSSTDFVTGSTRFGSLMSNTHQFTGSVSITGSLNVIGTGITGSLLGTASRADNATSASYALTATSASYSNNSTSASYALNATSASYALNATSASFAPTATNVYIQGGNSFGAQALLGTNDVQNLAFETSGSVRMLISGSTGFVGIGSTSPSSELNILGSTPYITLQGSDASYTNAAVQLIATGASNQRALGIFMFQSASQVEWYSGQPYNGADNWMIARRSTTTSSLQSSPRGETAQRTFSLLYVSASGNVGIGTTVPIAKLVVTGNGTGQGLIGDLFGSGNYTGISLNGTSSGTAYNFLSSPTDNALYINRPSGNAIKFREANGSDQLTIATGGNVGIGTTAPGRQLEIYNATDAYLKFNGQRGGNRAYTIGNDTSGFIIYDDTSGVYRMVISGSNGNVGIGTITPSQKLVVQGTIAAASTNGYTLNGVTNGNQVFTSDSSPRGIAGLTAIGAGASFAIKTDPLGRAFGVVGLVGAAYEASGGGRNALGVYGYALQDAPTGSNTENKPVAGLFISELSSSAGQFSPFTGTVYGVYASANSSAASSSAGSTIGVYGVATGRSGDTTFGGYFNASGGTTNYGLIVANGSVGIGSTAPGARLDIAGDTFGRGVIFGYVPSTSTQYGGLSYGLLGSTDGFLFLKTGGTTTVQLQSSGSSYFNAGNVGIGTTTPTVNLHVSGASGGVFKVDGASASTALYVNSNGNIGVGTTSTGVYIDGGNGKGILVANAGRAGIRFWDNTNVVQYFDIGVNAGTAYIGAVYSQTPSIVYDAYSDHTFKTNSSTRLYIKNDGNVGIGTTTPATNLHVSGVVSIGATSVSTEGNLYLGPKSTTEGGQIFFQAGTSYTSASMLDVYNDGANPYFRILRGSNISSDAIIAQFNIHTKQFILPSYNSTSSFAGTATAYLAVDATGSVITVAGTGGASLSGGSTNYVARWASSTTLTTGSLFDNGTNVGIGTTTPIYPFNVVIPASGSRQDLTNINRAAGNFITFTNPQYSTIASIGLLLRVFPQSDSRQGAGIVVSGGTNNGATDLSIFTSTSPDGLASTSSADLTITGNNKYVGIGTTTPSVKLQVVGDGLFNSNTNTNLTINSNGGVAILTLTNGAGSQAIYGGVGGSNVMDFYTNSAFKVRIDANGNVGIGTTAPTAKLQIAGGSLDTGTLYDLGLSSALTTGRLGTFDASSLASISTRGDASSVELAAGSSTNYYSGISATANNASLFAGTLRFVTSGSERMRVTSDGTLMVGTTSQTYNNATYGYAASFKGAVTTQAYISVALSNQTSTSQGMLFGLTSTTGDIYVLDNKPLVFYTNGTAKMRIAADGNVGIGTTNPTALFTIDSAEPRIRLNRSGVQHIIINHDGTTGTIRNESNTPLQIGTNGAAVMTVTGSNVGIGSSTPNAALNIYNGVTEGKYLNVDALAGFAGIGSGSGAMITFNNKNDGNNVLIRTANSARTDAAPFAVWTENNSRFIILNNGNIGIGSSSPTYTLDVLSTSTPVARFTGATNAYIDFSDGTVSSRIQNSGGLLIGTTTSHNVVFRTNATTRVTIDTAGNVGIGSTAPAYTLEVVGTQRTSGNFYFFNTVTNVASGFSNQRGAGFDASTGQFQVAANSTTAVEFGRFGTSGSVLVIRNAGTSVSSLETNGGAWFSGSVGIGSNSPAYALDVNGTGRFTAIIETSTRTLKDNIQSYATEIDKFKQLEPVSFTWKETGKQDVGLIAEDVEKIFPEFVSKTDDGDVQGINYGKLATIFINVLKQQQEKIELLEEQIKKLTS